jgi:hypothetical protein
MIVRVAEDDPTTTSPVYDYGLCLWKNPVTEWVSIALPMRRPDLLPPLRNRAEILTSLCVAKGFLTQMARQI